MKHKHYDCIVAWAEGKKIEFAYPHEPNIFHVAASHDVNPVTWPNLIWRIKKEPVIEVKYYEPDIYGNYIVTGEDGDWNLKITYLNGKAVEVEVAE